MRWTWVGVLYIYLNIHICISSTLICVLYLYKGFIEVDDVEIIGIALGNNII